MDIPIIYEDDNVVAINKPSGLTVHPDGRTKEETLVDWIIEWYPEVENVGEALVLGSGEQILRPGIVHRLDKETSGVLILTKNKKSYLHLKRQFKERKVEKVYNAFVYGKLKDSKGVIDKAIGRSRRDFRLRSTNGNVQGKPRGAITYYAVLKTGKDFSYVEARPKTGRMHQIRVHFKTIHHPVVCDKLYAPKRACGLGFKRLALHARSLAIELSSQEKIIVEAPFPEDFERALTFFG